MNKWEAGDIAICKITGTLPEYTVEGGKNPPLRLNAEYIVNAINICGDCGIVKLDVGLFSSGDSGTKCGCGAKSKPGTGIHWANAARFVKKKTREAIQEEVDEAIHNENYELAHELSQQLNSI